MGEVGATLHFYRLFRIIPTMSQPRRTERKLRQGRKMKLAKLRGKYTSATMQTDKDAILSKAVLVSPYRTKSQYQEAWGK